MVHDATKQKLNRYISELKTTYETIETVDENIKKLTIDLENKEAEQDDLLHEIELANLNAIERVRVFNKLKTVRDERRLIKDELIVLKTIKPIADIMTKKGVFAELSQTIINLNTCRKNLEERKYNAKIRKDLKCVK